jgi:hypothetical protein
MVYGQVGPLPLARPAAVRRRFSVTHPVFGTSVRVTAAQIGQIWRLAHADYVDLFGRA